MASVPHHEVMLVPRDDPELRENLLDHCFAIRIEVFHHEQKFPLETEIDDRDDTATHFLLRLRPSLKPVGTTRCYRTRENGRVCYRLSRLCVLKDYRGYGFGHRLMVTLHDWVMRSAERNGLSSIDVLAHSQIPVMRFYERFGYEAVGDEDEEDGVPHQMMVVHLQTSGDSRNDTSY